VKIVFLASVLCGLLATAAGARFYPWVNLERLPSHTSVVANGGRAEQFLIRLPADLIAGHGSSDAGLRAAAFPGTGRSPAVIADPPLLVEQFKVRDRSGSVIGIAARHWTEVEGEAVTTWLLTIPSRGAVLLAAPGEARRAVDRALTSGGWRSGEQWSGAVEVVATAGSAQSGRVVAGRDEFAELEGSYTETWRIAGVGAGGELRGTIELDTIIFQGRQAARRSE
jgi:hypothetical protein